MPTPSTYSFSFSASLTGNTLIDSLISGTYWLGSNWSPYGATNLSYSFMAPVTSYFVTDYSPDNEYNALYALTSGQQSAVTAALGAWSAVANLTFTLTSDNINNVGDLRFGAYRLMDDKTAAWAYFPGNSPVAGDVWIGPQTNDPTPGKGSYDYLTFVHEIGHALGLKHPFDVSPTNKTLLDPSMDDVHFTVMSYNNNYSYLPTTPMVLDLVVIQTLYGANMLWQTGDNVYKWDANQSVFETIWDAGGNDTIDGSNQLAAVSINLNEGTFSQIGKAFVDLNTQTATNLGLAIAIGAKIENALGSAFSDTLTGNALDNSLNGLAGADTMIGGDGNDTYYVDNIGDVVVESNNAATQYDRVFASIDYTLGANVENVILTGTADINATGNELNNRVLGNIGNNLLNGMAGADTMIGGAGDDTYIVDNAADTVTELANEGRDLVKTSVSYNLSANVEDGLLTGTADLTLNGNQLNNLLTGNDGANTLNGLAGADTMIGGDGNDTYYVDNIGDVVVESNNAATQYDRVFSSIDYTLGANVENVILTGTADLSATGNELNNRVLGNEGSNTLNGMAGNDTLIGGLGADTMTGGSGADLFVFNDWHETGLGVLRDVITDFSQMEGDKIDLRAFDANLLQAGFNSFSFIGAADFTGAGQLRFVDHVLSGNVSGNAGADFEIQLVGVNNFSVTDLVA